MSYDSTKPVNGTLVDADFLRGQFNALNDRIDAVPAGPAGPQGSDGPPGPQGPTGEVSSQQLADGLAVALAAAAANSSANTNGVTTLDTPFVNDPPTLADIEVLRAKVNELINTMRR